MNEGRSLGQADRRDSGRTRHATRRGSSPSRTATARSWWIHRRTADSRHLLRRQPERAAGRLPSKRASASRAGRPSSGIRTPANASRPSYRIAGDGRTTLLPLHLDARGSVFVVFRRATSVLSRVLHRARPEPLWPRSPVHGRVSFPPEPGSPVGEQVRLDSLTSWTTSADAGVKYFWDRPFIRRI